MMNSDLVLPNWSLEERVGAISTTRRGGVSTNPWSSLNLGDHCGDDSEAVMVNRNKLRSVLPNEPIWLQQVHGTEIFDADTQSDSHPVADGAVTSAPGRVLAVLTADCLPVLLCTTNGTRIGVAHAGWRGLCDGVIEATIAAMKTSPENVVAWLGPCISQDAYEVGEDVFESFSNRSGSDLVKSLRPEGEKWRLDLTGAATRILSDLGLKQIFEYGGCTFKDESRFFSYRRDGVTGRMASLIWLRDEF